MQFSFSDEQEEFRRGLRRFLEERSPTTEVRRLMETEAGYDSAVWRQLSEELGVPGLRVPEAYGGSGFGFVELGIVLEEMGRSLLCSPFFASSVLASSAILNGADESQKQALLPELASGETIGTFAFTEPNGGWDTQSVELVAEPAGNRFKLSGSKSFVIDGSEAQMTVVIGRAPGSQADEGLSLFCVRGEPSGLRRSTLQTIDATRKLARMDFDAVEAELIGPLGGAANGYLKTLDEATVAISTEMAGGMQALFDSAIEYTRQRMQFGRTIASFQAIKHRCADLLLEVESAKSAAYYAAEAADHAADVEESLAEVASIAKAAVSDAYMHAAVETIQLHGGIGFTWDNDTHLWYKRAKSSEVYLGDASYHRERLIQQMEARA